MKPILVAVSLLVPASAFACGGKPQVADNAAQAETTTVAAAAVDPTHCAKRGELVGGNCSYTTGMMAQRVIEEGKPFSFVGTLAAAGNELESRVAAPYTVGPKGEIHVVANEVLEGLVTAGAVANRVELNGKVLVVDGVTYFVAEQYAPQNS